MFNAEQIDNLPPHFTAPAAPILDPVQRIAHADAFFAATRAEIRQAPVATLPPASPAPPRRAVARADLSPDDILAIAAGRALKR